MKNMKVMLLILISTVLSIAVISGEKPDTTSIEPSNKLYENIVLNENRKTITQNLVDIEIEFYPTAGDYWEFNVNLDTHSVDLTDLDLTEYIIFKGNVVVDNTNGLAFTSTGEGHHIQNKLLVPKFVDNVATLNNNNQEFELEILPIDGSESNVLVWEFVNQSN
ncbi:MAG: hypothetical protein K8R73_00055 [Clostridiales bacterium]|nr:hypothetical protein [Clostridiales bacterium]